MSSNRPLPPNRRIVRAQSEPSMRTPAAERRPSSSPGRFRRFLKAITPGERVLSIARAIAGITLFLGIVVSLSWGLFGYISKSPRFSIKNIQIEGAVRRSTEDIARLAGVAQGNNIFALDLEQAQVAITRDPWIRQASISRKLPGTIKITVTEREATSLVSVGGDLYLASHGGDLFKRVEPGDPIDFPVVTGIAADGDRNGATILVRRAQDIVTEYERMPIAKKMPLQEVHLTEEGGASILVGRETVMLALGHGPYRIKLERAARVLGEVDKRKGQVSTIFLDNEAHPERVVARLR
ncbi:MAG: FtsQ-type POTRA domain-containing protein [Polyangiaceae bacterium]